MKGTVIEFLFQTITSHRGRKEELQKRLDSNIG